MDKQKLDKSTTTDGKPPAEGFENAPAPQPEGPSGQAGAYWVLSAEERSKGFVRPVRLSYKHVGVQPEHPLRDLTADEHERYDQFNYAKYEEYPKSADEGDPLGRFWTEAQLNSGCGTETTMAQSIAETYARDPSYYGSTFCMACSDHLPVEQFVWLDDGSKLGS